MNQRFGTWLVSLVLLLVAAATLLLQTPFAPGSSPKPLSEFSTGRALDHVRALSRTPHFLGSQGHKAAGDYIIKEMRQMGLEVQIQEGFSLTEWGNLAFSRNLLARIPGTESGKALLLLSHYDSAPHSFSKGAADDASGVAVILEAVRAYVHSRKTHRNDIILLFTDGEELGLNGAALFVQQHPWIKDVGLALNFEARGTSGPAFMLMETTGGNRGMVDIFSESGTWRPNANSLMYSIYKMMPNDTDLTVFREQGGVQGFNFAFIDSHYNYHTAQDDFSHLDPASLEHESEYLIPMLQHGADADLTRLNKDTDEVYFSSIVGFWHYPFSWNLVLWGIGALLFGFLVFVGFGKRMLQLSGIAKGFLVFLSLLIVVGALVFLLWKLLLWAYPGYGEILQGFTYNGHWYIATMLTLALGIAFLWYAPVRNEQRIGNFAVAPLFLWLVVVLGLMVYLPGAGFFILPLLASLCMFGYYILTQKTRLWLNALLTLPCLLWIFPFTALFPVGLGLKLLAGSAVLLVLCFGLLLPLFGLYKHKAISGILLVLAAIGLFVTAHFHSGFGAGQAKPNSLVFCYDAERDISFWGTYDKVSDEWTKTYLSNPVKARKLNELPLFSKYDTQFTLEQEAINRDLAEPEVQFELDSLEGAFRHYRIRIIPQRPVNRYDIFTSPKMPVSDLVANGARNAAYPKGRYHQKDSKLLSYYVSGQQPLLLDFRIPANAPFGMELLESSFDLMHNPAFSMRKRADWMMPKPFVLTDAVMIRSRIRPHGQVGVVRQLHRNFRLDDSATNDTIQDPEMEVMGSENTNAPKDSVIHGNPTP